MENPIKNNRIVNDITFALRFNNFIQSVNVCDQPSEEEKKLLIDKLAEVGKRWNEEKKCLEDVRWRAKKGKLYRWVSADGYVKESTDEHGECDNCYYNQATTLKQKKPQKK